MRVTIKKIVLLLIIFLLIVLLYQLIVAHRISREWKPFRTFPEESTPITDEEYTAEDEFSSAFIKPNYYVMVACKEGDEARIWTFVKPFTPGMWGATGAIMMYTALVVWLLEQKINPPAPNREMSIKVFLVIWSAVSTMSLSQNVRIESRSGRIVIAVWLVVMSIIVSSYSSNFNLRLNAQETDPSITTRSLRGRLSVVPIGYLNKQHDAIQYYLSELMGIQYYLSEQGNLKAYATEEECLWALSQGPKRGGVAAILMELYHDSYHDFRGYTAYRIIPDEGETPCSLGVKDFSGWFIITLMVSTLAVMLFFSNLLYNLTTMNPDAQVTDESPADQRLDILPPNEDPEEQSESVQAMLGSSNISNDVPLLAQGASDLQMAQMLPATDDAEEQ